MSAYVLLNLLNELEKSDKMRGLPSIIYYANFSYVCIIYVKIYEKMSSGGLEVSLSIHT